MYNYRKKQSIYILTYCRIVDELPMIYYLTTDLQERSTPEKLLELRKNINNLIEFVDSVPIYGKSKPQRKIKGSMYFEHKSYIIDKLKEIKINIDDTLTAGKERIIKGANTLNKIKDLENFTSKIPVYFYNNELEEEKKKKYYRYYKELKKKKR